MGFSKKCSKVPLKFQMFLNELNEDYHDFIKIVEELFTEKFPNT